MTEKDILRVGIIGTGWIAEKAAITLAGLDNCEAYAVGSRSQEKAEAFANKHGVGESALDGIGVGLGFTCSLTVLGLVREILG